MQDIDEPLAASTFHLDRPSARTDAEREDHFQHWLTKYGQPYSDAVIEAGDKPWFNTIDERRELFYRRYTRPAPPVGLSIPRLGSVRNAKPLSPHPADDTEEAAA